PCEPHRLEPRELRPIREPLHQLCALPGPLLRVLLCRVHPGLASAPRSRGGAMIYIGRSICNPLPGAGQVPFTGFSLGRWYLIFISHVWYKSGPRRGPEQERASSPRPLISPAKPGRSEGLICPPARGL